jgi:hypothetical protein
MDRDGGLESSRMSLMIRGGTGVQTRTTFFPTIHHDEHWYCRASTDNTDDQVSRFCFAMTLESFLGTTRFTRLRRNRYLLSSEDEFLTVYTSIAPLFEPKELTIETQLYPEDI